MTKAKTTAKAAVQTTKTENKKTTVSVSKSPNFPKFTIKQLLEAGVHFGHKTSRRNTKMIPYLFGVRNKLNIINLQKTGALLHKALEVAYQVAKNNGRILFVATKKQASDVIADSAKKCSQYYVNQRWLGGMLTNWKTVSKSIKTLRDIEEQLANDDLGLNKKEKLVLERKRQKLENALGGIKDMGGYPDLVFVIDTHREKLAILEAKKIGAPVMAILDSNCNPDNVTYPIPGNDDSIKSIKLYCHLLSEAILAGIKDNLSGAGVNLQKAEEKPQAPKEEVKTTKETSDKEEPKVSISKEAQKELKAATKKIKESAKKEETSTKETKTKKPSKTESKEVKTKKAAAKKPTAKK